MKRALLPVALPLSFSLCSTLCFSLLACTLYKSSDRDSFNQNALAGAPTASTLAMKVGAKECWILPTAASRTELTPERSLIQEFELLCAFAPDVDVLASQTRMIHEWNQRDN